MRIRLDRSSPVPLYHQLAEGLRWRISTGELQPGQRLPSLRAAAAELGVNLHTVRAAYETLAQEGLVESDGARGTRVQSRSRRPAEGGGSPEALVQRFVVEARRRFGLTADELSRRVAEAARLEVPPQVTVVECSLAQCRDHAEELQRAFAIEASPFPLDRDGEPPPGPVLATYFHYGDVVRRWPRRRNDLLFVAVRPDAALADELERRFPGERRAVACELDEVRAVNLAADLEAVLGGGGWTVEPLASPRPAEALAGNAGRPICFSPRAWAALDDVSRTVPQAVRVRYLIEPESMEAVSRRLASNGAAEAT